MGLPRRGDVITYHTLMSPNPSRGLGVHHQPPPGLAQFLDHRVGGRALFPGAGFFELADAAVNFGDSMTEMSANGENFANLHYF